MSIEEDFPQLNKGYFKVTSPSDIQYNCMAWAMEDNTKWWEPSDAGYWPTDCYDFSLTSYFETLKALGFSECDSPRLECDTEKIALYSLDGEVTHVARQLESGRWTSKLGSDKDIEHDLDGLEGDIFGKVSELLRRPKNAVT